MNYIHNIHDDNNNIIVKKILFYYSVKNSFHFKMNRMVKIMSHFTVCLNLIGYYVIVRIIIIFF